MKASLLTLVLLTSKAVPAGIPPDVDLEAVPGVSGLSSPLGLKHAGDGSGRVFIVEQGGTVRIVDATGTLLAEPFIDIGDRAVSGGERGLLDIAFHPEFVQNGLFYLHYSDRQGCDQKPAVAPCGDTVIAEFSVSADANVADEEPERIILSVAQDFSNHNGGQMRFGPDGYLYLGLGDGGSGNDPCDRAQTLDPDNIVTGGSCGADRSVALLGKMLRVDVDNTTPPGNNNLCAANGDGSANYAVPAANPFAGQENRCGEVLLYGLRNPWRWSFDRQTQDLWIGDVGQNTWEEVDLLEGPLVSGEDLGWKICEASRARGSTTMPCPNAGSVLPVLEYRRNNGNCSVTGGYRYRGFIRSLRGRYIYGDLCSGDIWFADNASGSWQAEEFPQDLPLLRSFGEDEVGNVYVIANDQLHRFVGEEIFIDEFESP